MTQVMSIRRWRWPLEIERKLNIIVDLPQICYFCEDDINTFEPHKSESLIFHSLDGNHDNWDPKNKVSVHLGCHMRYHASGPQTPEHIFNRSKPRDMRYDSRHKKLNLPSSSNRKAYNASYYQKVTKKKMKRRKRKKRGKK